MIYFDHNATTPLSAEARQAWLDAVTNFVGNPSSPHRVGGRAEVALNDAREKLAGILGCYPLDLVWTSGATESNNAVFAHFLTTLAARARVWVSALEHPSVIEPARRSFAQRVEWIPSDHHGGVDLEWMRKRIQKSRPSLVAVMAANNETGVLQPWRDIAQLCRKFSVPFFCDATQWIGKLPGANFGQCDFVSGSAHKFGGPKGIGFLKVAGRGRFLPLLRGGPQEAGRRAGTENVPGVLAMMAALEAREAALAAKKNANEKSRLTKARADFERRLLERVPGAEIIGANSDRLWNTVSALMPDAGQGKQRWVVKLDKLGFAVSTGSACASGKEAPSHVLAAMGYSPAQASRVLRFSSGWDTTEKDWQALLEAIEKVNRDLRV